MQCSWVRRWVGLVFFKRATNASCWLKIPFRASICWLGGKRQHPPFANKEKSKNVFHMITFVVGFQGFSLPRRLYGCSVQQCVFPLRESFLCTCGEHGQEGISTLSGVPPTLPLLPCCPVKVSGPGEHSPPSLTPLHSLSGTESCCSSGRTCLQHKTSDCRAGMRSSPGGRHFPWPS